MYVHLHNHILLNNVRLHVRSINYCIDIFTYLLFVLYLQAYKHQIPYIYIVPPDVHHNIYIYIFLANRTPSVYDRKILFVYILLQVVQPSVQLQDFICLYLITNRTSMCTIDQLLYRVIVSHIYYILYLRVYKRKILYFITNCTTVCTTVACHIFHFTTVPFPPEWNMGKIRYSFIHFVPRITPVPGYTEYTHIFQIFNHTRGHFLEDTIVFFIKPPWPSVCSTKNRKKNHFILQSKNHFSPQKK